MLEYDCICVGTSMIMSLEACFQASKGHNVLMVDKEKTTGGAWKTLTIDGIEKVENAIHYFLPDEKGMDFLRKDLKFEIEPSQGKYRYFKFLNLLYLKFSFSSLTSRFIHKILNSDNQKSILAKLKNLYSIFLEVYQDRGQRSFYTPKGSAGMLEKIEALLHSYNLEIWYESEIIDLYFDLQQERIFCQIGNKTVIAQSLILGHGARLPKLKSSNGHLTLKEKFHRRPAFHLVVEDHMQSNVLEAIINSDPLIKYVHDVTRFTSIGGKEDQNKKVFVFALKSQVVEHLELPEKLFFKLKKLKIIGQHSRLVTSLYSDILLPTINDEDLYKLKDHFGNLVNVLRTENFAKGIGYYADRWREKL